VDPAVLAALEQIAIGSVAITARAIAAAAEDLTFLQWRALVVIGAEPGGVTVGDVAMRVGLQPSPASRLVSRLAARGIVTSTPSPSDRRVRIVRLAARGRRLRATVLASRTGELRAIAESWPSDEAAQAAVVRLGEALGDAAS
jgi:DNA-binding MarR family transcriptional regulator